MTNISNLADKVYLLEFLLIFVEPSSAAIRQFRQTKQSISDPFHSQIKYFQIHQYLKPS